MTDVGARCSPNGKFPDWVRYTSSDPSQSGCASFSEFLRWGGSYLQMMLAVARAAPVASEEVAPPEPEFAPIATIEMMNALRAKQGLRGLIQAQYDRLVQRNLVPTHSSVLEQLEDLG